MRLWRVRSIIETGALYMGCVLVCVLMIAVVLAVAGFLTVILVSVAMSVAESTDHFRATVVILLFFILIETIANGRRVPINKKGEE